MKTYTIQAKSQPDGKWTFQARFREGEKTRWGTPFNDKEAVAETEGFRAARAQRYKFVRLVIDFDL
jgi:hypothetical protein